MTIEAQLERIANALESLTGAMNAEAATPAAPVETPAPMPTTQAPTAPSFAQPDAPVNQPPVEPAPVFANVAELTAFVMQEYQAMGAEKGAGIQSILQKYNYNNINDVQPQHFAAIKADIEALKAS